MSTEQVTAESRHVTASLVVIDPATAAVLLVDHKASGKWVFPGGHVDLGETPADAAVREVLEETGVAVRLVSDPGVAWRVEDFPAPPKPERSGKPAEPAHTHIDHLFVGVADSTAPLTAALSEVASARWVSICDLDGWDVRAEVPSTARAAYGEFSGLGAAS